MAMTRSKAQWILLVVAVSLWPSTARSEGAPEDARLHFERGRELEAAGNLAAALAEFQMAMELRPTFRLRRHMGRVCFGMGRFRDSLEHYQVLLREGGERLDATERREAQEAVAEILVTLATLRVVAEDGAVVHVDGVLVGQTPMPEPARLDPGAHRVEVRLDEHRDYVEQLELGPGEERILEVTLEPLPEQPDPGPVEPVAPVPVGPEHGEGESPEEDRRPVHRAAFWATMGVSAAMLVAGAVFGVLAIAELNEYDDLNQPDRTDEQDTRMDHLREDLIPSLSVAADVLIFTGAAGAVAAIVLAFFTDFDGDASEERARLTPSVTPGGAVLTLGGVF